MEAERYHNPKDPAMMQIKQLLNSGYKHGIPAIRLIGENMKPQTFDVYSPAAIIGLEDVLQALDLMTRHTTQLVWVKSAVLR